MSVCDDMNRRVKALYDRYIKVLCKNPKLYQSKYDKHVDPTIRNYSFVYFENYGIDFDLRVVCQWHGSNREEYSIEMPVKWLWDDSGLKKLEEQIQPILKEEKARKKESLRKQIDNLERELFEENENDE